MAFTVSQILAFVQGKLVNEADLELSIDEIRVDRPSNLTEARATDLSFFFSKVFESEIQASSPGVLITGEAFVGPLQAAQLPLWKKTAVISCRDPYYALAVLSEKFAAQLSSVAHLEALEKTEIHPTAIVAKSVELGPGVKIGPYCVIEEMTKIGPGTVLYPGCYIGPKCTIGENCVLFPKVSIYEWTQIGNRVRIHAGSVLGSDGFGYAPQFQNKQVTGHQKIFHLGRVVIGNDVEIGANSCVDRGTFGETQIASSVKLDNLVHIGHNAKLDFGAIICGGTCLAGNASVGKFAYVGGLTGIGNHVHVGDGAKVGALSMVTKDVKPGGTAVGNPQREHREHFRAHALLSKLASERRSK